MGLDAPEPPLYNAPAILTGDGSYVQNERWRKPPYTASTGCAGAGPVPFAMSDVLVPQLPAGRSGRAPASRLRGTSRVCVSCVQRRAPGPCGAGGWIDRGCRKRSVRLARVQARDCGRRHARCGDVCRSGAEVVMVRARAVFSDGAVETRRGAAIDRNSGHAIGILGRSGSAQMTIGDLCVLESSQRKTLRAG